MAIDYRRIERIMRNRLHGEDLVQEALCWAWELLQSPGSTPASAISLAIKRVRRGSQWAHRTQGHRIASVDCDTDAVGQVARSREVAPDRLAQARLDVAAVRSRLDARDQTILDGVLAGQDRDALAAELGCSERNVRLRIGAMTEIFAAL